MLNESRQKQKPRRQHSTHEKKTSTYTRVLPTAQFGEINPQKPYYTNVSDVPGTMKRS